MQPARPYDPKQRTGDRASPFNFPYWDFLARHRDRLAGLGRMGLVLRQLDQIEPLSLAKYIGKIIYKPTPVMTGISGSSLQN